VQLTHRWLRRVALGVPLLAGVPSAAGSSDGPIAAYAFDEGSGTTVQDSSGHGVTGTMYGTGPTFVASMPGHGTALSYVGSSVHGGLLLGTADMWDDVAQGTIEAWVKLSPLTNGYQMWFNARHDVNAGCQYPLELSVWSHGFSVFGAYPHTCEPPTLLASFALSSPGDWHHLAYVVGASSFAMYVDGELVTPTFTNGSSSTLYFFDKAGHSTPTVYDVGGADIDSEEWQGLIDDLRIYDRPLTQAEIQSDMQTPVPEPAAGGLGALGALAWIARRHPSVRLESGGP